MSLSIPTSCLQKWKRFYYEMKIVDANAVECNADIDAKTAAAGRVSRNWFD